MNVKAIDGFGPESFGTFCLAHPLYHPESIKQEQIFEKVGRNEKN